MRHMLIAVRNALGGLSAAWRGEVAFRQEVVILIPLAALGFFNGRTSVERALLIGSLFPILVAELLNTAVENTVDRIGLEQHPLSKKAKDTASSAVFLSFFGAGMVWVLIFLPRFGLS